MIVKRTAIILLYISIFLMLAPPSLHLPQNMVEIGPVNFYYFELPLLCSYLLAFFILIKERRVYGKRALVVYGLFIAIAVIGFIGALLHVNTSYTTVLLDLRPIVYWLSGIIVAIAGGRYIKLKTLSWVVIAGLAAEFILAIILASGVTSLKGPQEFRLTGRSGWFILFVASIPLMMFTHREKLKKVGKYSILPTAAVTGLLLVNVVMVKNRTTWVMLFILAVIWIMFFSPFRRKVKSIIFIPIMLILVWQGFQYIPETRQAFQSLPVKQFTNRLSKEGIVGAWKGVREVIYKSNIRDFKKHPVFGNGFGHEMYFDFTNYGRPRDRISTSSDNSFMTVLVKTGIIGLVLFIFAIYKIYRTMGKSLERIEDSDEWLYLKAMVFAFPFFIITALNIAILFSYPEVIIFSLFLSKSDQVH